MLNHIVIMGRLARDPELGRTQTGTPVASFRLAVERDFKDKASGERITDWIDVTAWSYTAEFVSRYFTKGRMAVVSGRLQTQEWTDRDGNKRTAFDVVADNVFFAEPKRDGTSSGSRYDSQVPQYNEGAPAFQNTGSGDFEEIVGDDHLPF